MTSTRLDMTVRGGRARRLEELKAELEDHLGYDVTYPRLLGELMRAYDGPAETAPVDDV